MISINVHGHPVNLKAWHDLSWLEQIGKVFCVFDQLISGNLCFGVDNGKDRFFIKYAGAPTLMFAGQAATAIKKLKETVPLYTELAHPGLSPLLGTMESHQGFALVFPWFQGFALAPLQHHFEHMRLLPLNERLAMFDVLMDFLALAERHDYLSAGLSNRRILVDYENRKAIFCSVNHFSHFPTMTPHPKLAGSGWYLPPEAYVPGTKLDLDCAVYSLGALAFTFFGQQKKPANWEAGRNLLNIALQAVQEKPQDRIQSIEQFQKEWRRGVLNIRDF